MKTKIEELKDNQVRLEVSFEAKEISDRIKKTYKDFSYKYSFPGFRRGKAPRPVVDNALGAEAVTATVTDELIKETYPLAVDESGIYPISQPEFEDQEALVEDGKAFTYTVKLETKPEYTLDSYDPVEILMPSEGATDAEIQDQIDAMREHYFSFEDAPAKEKATETSIVDLILKATDDKGEIIDSLTSDSRVYTIGSGLFSEEFEKELVGMKKGDKKTIDLKLEDNDSAGLASIAGQTEEVHFEVEIKAVMRKVIPDLSDEWVRDTLGFENIEDFKSRIAESIISQKDEALPRLKEERSLMALAERLNGEIPDALVEGTETELLQNFFQQLQSQSLNLDSYLSQQNITIDQFKDDIKKQAQELTKQDLALDAWAKHNDYKVSGKDLTEEFAKSGAEDPKALEEEWRNSGQLHTLRQGILRVRAIKDIMDTAIITEPDSEKKTQKKTAKKESEKKASTKKPEEKPSKETSGKKASPKSSDAKKKTSKKKEKEKSEE